MGNFRDDGSYESANTVGYLGYSSNSDSAIYRCLVIAVYAADNLKNISRGAANIEVTYDVIVLGGKRYGHVLTNVRDAKMYGGQYTYSEKIWKANTKPVSKFTSTTDQDGDIVYVGFLDNDPNFPIILGGAPHPLNGIAANFSDMPRQLFQYNGINVLIDNKGQLYVTRLGGTLDSNSASFTPGSTPQSNIELLNNQVIIKDVAGSIITIDAPSKSIIISTPQEFKVTANVMTMIANNSYSLTTKTVSIVATTSVTIKTPDTELKSDVVNVQGQNGGDSQVSLNGSSFKVVSTNSYDPFLMGPHIDGYTKVTTKG